MHLILPESQLAEKKPLIFLELQEVVHKKHKNNQDKLCNENIESIKLALQDLLRKQNILSNNEKKVDYIKMVNNNLINYQKGWWSFV